MRLLLDENVPRKLKQDLKDYTVFTIQELKRTGNEDEEVLQFLMDFNINALITCDKNLRHQQNLDKYPTPIIILDTYTNAYPILKLTVPKLLALLQMPLPTGVTIITLP